MFRNISRQSSLLCYEIISISSPLWDVSPITDKQYVICFHFVFELWRWFTCNP